ncbi:MAG TPA: T9SS type A sorting domain-containing protein [Chitinophagaceae bacterium]|jgi:hypothetical protein|nr:T9SS type A sorting domain-containing protein [Chitinophagaceae bacterium]
MKTPRPLLFLCLLLSMQMTVTAQVQWYQNQDGNNPPPYGTVATTVQRFTSNTFIACYLWSSNNELNTWKISKSNDNGAEQKTFFTTGISATVECKIGKNNCVYVFERSFTAEYAPLYKVYKLDVNLHMVSQRNISFPNGYTVYNINAFEIDEQGNVYFAGDGQYPNAGGSLSPASFVIKANKNLVNIWQRMDSTETSFARLHVDGAGRVLIIQDYYTFFPEVRIKRYSSNGQIMAPFTVQTDINRYSLYSALDNDDNILLYGGKTVEETSQAIFLKRVSRFNGSVAYSKTHFTAPSSQLNDFKIDEHGNIFTLVSQYFGPENQKSRISRINLSNGNIAWNRTINFADDSCNLSKLVLTPNERIYAVGERRSCTYFSKGFAMRVKKNNGQLDENFPAPDSVAFQRSHWLADGIVDNDNQLIAIGNTSDFDTVTYSNNYFRSFAVRFGNNHHGGDCFGKGGIESAMTADAVMNAETIEAAEATEETVGTKLTVYPNPAQNQLLVSNLDPAEYDRMTIYTVQGVKLQQQSINSTTGKMNISRLPDGLYLLVLNSATTMKTKTFKFMVKK